MKNRNSIIQHMFDKAVQYRVEAVNDGYDGKTKDADRKINYVSALLEQLEFADPSQHWHAKLFDAVWEICGRG